MTTRQRYEKHLKKVCHNKMLRQSAMDFYDDFCEYFQGKKFTKDNFETLNINGIIVEQDIVCDLFKDKTEALPEEILTYLFTHNVNYLYNLKRPQGGRIGYFSPIRHVLCVYVKSLKHEFKSKEHELIKQGNKKGYKNKKKEILAEIKANITQATKKTVYHELGHICQLRTFLNGKYIKSELSKEVQFKGGEYGVGYNDVITRRNTRESIDYYDIAYDIKYSVSARDLWGKDESFGDYLTDKMISEGYEAISEYMNEELSLKILKQFPTKQGYNSYEIGEGSYKFQRKKKVDSNCGYTHDYDISELIKIATGNIDELDMCFNGAKYFDRIKNLKVSEKTLEMSKEKLNQIFKTTLADDETESRFELEIISKRLNKLDLVDTIGLAMGMYLGYGNKKLIDTKINCKLIVQTILIEAITNNILNDLSNELVEKDAKFYQKLNNTLETIDSVILYPKGETQYRNINEQNSAKLVYDTISNIEEFTVEEYASRFSNMSHITTFANLCKIIKDMLKNAQHKEDIEQLLPFFAKQKKLKESRLETVTMQTTVEQRCKCTDRTKTKIAENEKTKQPIELVAITANLIVS